MNTNYSSQQIIPSLRRTISFETWLSSIDNRINDLKEEQKVMMQIASKLSYYLHDNAIAPYNDDIIAYLELFIHEEKMKLDVDRKNQSVLEGLERLTEQYKEEMHFLQKYAPNSKSEDTVAMKMSGSTSKRAREIFDLVEELYALPINGSLIREQVEGLKQAQSSKIGDDEIFIDVSCYGPISSVTVELQYVLSPVDDNYF